MKSKRLQQGLIVLGLVICGGLTFLMYYFAENPASARDLKKKYGADLLKLCDPPPTSQAVINQASTGPLARVLVLEAGSRRGHGLGDALPAEWKATNQADVGLVVCIERKKVQDYVCQNGKMYGTTTGGTVEVEVTQATVIDPVSGSVLARINFQTGSGSQACSAKYAGTPEQFVEAVRGYVLGGAAAP